MTSSQSNEYLASLPDGAYLVRWSNQEPGKFVVVFNFNGQTHKTLIYSTNGGCYTQTPDNRPPKRDEIAPNIPALLQRKPEHFKYSAVELRARQPMPADVSDADLAELGSPPPYDAH